MAHKSEMSVSQLDENNALPHEGNAKSSWSESDMCDNIDELILSEAMALAKIIKAQVSGDVSDGAGDAGDTSEDAGDDEEQSSDDSTTDMTANSQLQSNDRDVVKESDSAEMFTAAKPVEHTTHSSLDNDNTGFGDPEERVPIKLDPSKFATSVQIPVTSLQSISHTNISNSATLSTDDVPNGIETTTGCFVIMAQLVPLVSSGFYVIECENSGQMLDTNQPRQDKMCSEIWNDEKPEIHSHSITMDGTDKCRASARMDEESSFNQSFPNSPHKHDMTLDEEFFSCEESFTAHDMTLKQMEYMTDLECHMDESDEQTLSLPSSDSGDMVCTDAKGNSTPRIDSPTNDDSHRVDCYASDLQLAEDDFAMAENEKVECKRPKQNDHAADQEVNKITDHKESTSKVEGLPNSSAPREFSRGGLVQGAFNLLKMNAGLVCESVTADEQDSVTDAGYQASESSGQEDTGYEEGETDGMNAMISEHPLIRRQRVQEVAIPARQSIDICQFRGTSECLNEDNTPRCSNTAERSQEVDVITSPSLNEEHDSSERTDVIDSSESMQLIRAESLVMLRPRISGSELSETLSCVSISRETTGKTSDGGEDYLRKGRPVSLYVELAEAEHVPNVAEKCPSSARQEGFNETIESDIDDAEAMFAKSRCLVTASQVNVDPEEKKSSSSSSVLNGQVQTSNKEVLALAPGHGESSELSHKMSLHSVENKSNPECQTDVSSKVGTEHLSDMDINQHHHHHHHHHHNHHSGRVSDDIVSDVTSEHSLPTSGSQCSSSPSDELLHLLDKITMSGYGMKTQLEMAYARQAFIHDIGTKVDEIRSSVIRDLQEELDHLRAENHSLLDKLALYKNHRDQDAENVQHLETQISKLQMHTEDLEANITEQKAKSHQRTMSRKHMAVGTDVQSVWSTATQTGCGSQPESEMEFGKGLDNDQDSHFEMRTSTPSQLYMAAISPRSELHSPAIIRGSVELEGDQPPKRMPSMVSLMIDKILHQMNNLADVNLNNSLNTNFCNHDSSLSTQDGQQEAESEQEGPDKWRRLSVAPVSMDPNVLILQRSLAAASFENELLRASTKTADKALSHQVERLSKEVDEYKNLLMKAKEEVEVLKLKLSGDQVEMDLLHDQITALEKSLSRAQEENASLRAQLDKISAEPVPDVDKSKELELQNQKLLDENRELQKKLEEIQAIKNKLEQDLASRVENSEKNEPDRQHLAVGEQHSSTCSAKEVVISHEEYDHLHNAMNFLQKFLEEYSQAGLISASSGRGITRQGETQNDNTVQDADINEGANDSQDVNNQTSAERREDDKVGPAEAPDGDKCEAGEEKHKSSEDNMSFPIYKADIEELKTHVFGWRRLHAGSSLANNTNGSDVREPSAARFRDVQCAVPGTPVTDGFSMMRGTMAKYGSLAGSSHSAIPLAGGVASPSPGGSTLHDDIMKQSEMVLDIIKESGDIKDADVPPAVFHWQDVRNSIAYQLLNESHQKIEKPPQSETVLSKLKETKDAKLTGLLKKLESYLKDKDGCKDGADVASKNTDEDIKSKLPDSIRILMKAVEQELGASVNITIQTGDDQPVKVNLNCSVSEKSEPDSDKQADAERLEERKDIDKRKERYKEEFDRINAEYEELRKKRLSLLVQAYTGKQDPRPLSSKASSPAVDTAENSKALALAKALNFKSRSADSMELTLDRTFDSPRAVAENKSPSAEYLASQTRVQRDLYALAQKENPSSVNDVDGSRFPLLSDPCSGSIASSMGTEAVLKPKPNKLLSSRDNRTISAISQDSQLIKERIQAVREQLTKAQQKHGKSVGYANRYYGYADDNETDEPVEDEFDEYSPTKLSTAKSERLYDDMHRPLMTNTNKARTPRREIYPHKKTYEPSSVFWQRCRDENDDSKRIENTPLDDVEVEDIYPASRRGLAQPLDEAWDDLRHEDYLKYPENRESSIAESSHTTDVIASKRRDPNISGSSSKERLNKSLRELHDYYYVHDRSQNREDNLNIRDEQRQPVKEQNKVMISEEQLDRLAQCLDSKNSSLDQSFYLKQGSRNDTTTQDLPVDPCSFSQQECFYKYVKSNDKDVTSRSKFVGNEEPSHHHYDGQNASLKGSSFNLNKEHTLTNEDCQYGSKNNMKSVRESQISRDHELSPDSDTLRLVNNKKQAVIADKNIRSPYQRVDTTDKETRARNHPNAVNQLPVYKQDLNDSVHTLDSCNCVCINTSKLSYPGERSRDGISDLAECSITRTDKEPKYDQFDWAKGTEANKDICHSHDERPVLQEAKLGKIAMDEAMRSDVSASSLMADRSDTTSRRSEDEESASTSDAELVVTKGGEILKRPRSTSPTHNILPERDLNVGEDHQSIFQELPTSESIHNKNLEETTSRYCEAICNDILNSPYSQPAAEIHMKWSEPRRHFGLRESKTKGVTWAEPASSSTNSPYAKPLSEANGAMLPSETYQQNKGILKTGKNSVESKPGSLLTDEQRQYADKLISHYTSNLDRNGTRNDQENLSDGTNPAASSQSEDSVSFDSQHDKKCHVNDQQLVEEIIQKYAKECSNKDDQEITEITSKVSYLADMKQDCLGQSNVNIPIKNSHEADEIIQKYVQRTQSETNSILIKS